MIQESLKEIRQAIDKAMQETETIRAEFPHIAGEMLSSPEKIEEYRSKLGYRMQAAKEEKARRELEIQKMLEGVRENE